MQDTGWQVHVLTKGPYRTIGAWSEKVSWCRHYLPGTPVTITEHKGLVYGRILFDDWPEYCRGWLEWRPRGLVIMPEYKYNENFVKEWPGSIIRGGYHNIDTIKSLIDRVGDREPGEEW